jgi:DNA-binding NarL/FixJ family response regulator
MNHVLIVDDLKDARELLTELVLAGFPQATVTTADSVLAAQSTISAQRFDLALVDLSLGDGMGTEVIALLRQRQPECMAVVASIHDDDERLFAALKAGASGYLLKDQPAVLTLRQLQQIADGQPPLSPAIARRLLAHFRGQPGTVSESVPDEVLTPREREVLGLLARGFTLTDIARQLAISRHTVGDHVKNLYRKLDISSRAEAALHAQRFGLT